MTHLITFRDVYTEKECTFLENSLGNFVPETAVVKMLNSEENLRVVTRSKHAVLRHKKEEGMAKQNPLKD